MFKKLVPHYITLIAYATYSKEWAYLNTASDYPTKLSHSTIAVRLAITCNPNAKNPNSRSQ